MKPLEATTPVARWMLRITLLLFLYFNYFSVVKSLDFESLNFYIAALNVVSGIFLIFGALFSKPGLTIIPSIIIFLISIYLAIKNTSGIPDQGILKYIIPGSIAFLFLSTGNDS